jgi:hypothetical protein
MAQISVLDVSNGHLDERRWWALLRWTAVLDDGRCNFLMAALSAASWSQA